MTLDEIMLANTQACFEPALDYVVTKMPRLPFDKFADANNRLSTQMKATGEVMSIGRTCEESLLKAVRSLEIGVDHIYMPKFDTRSDESLLEYIRMGTDDRIFAIACLLRRGIDIGMICDATQIDMLFLEKFKKITDAEKIIEKNPNSLNILISAKKMGFSDSYIAKLWNVKEDDIFELRKREKIFPVYKMIDTCASLFNV